MNLIQVFRYSGRLFYFLPGLVKGLFKIGNNYARDMEMKKRYPRSVIDSGCSASYDTQIGVKTHLLSGCIINHSTIETIHISVGMHCLRTQPLATIVLYPMNLFVD